jgi:6-phosphogluconolactonase/glucosamine-6-phosphate isomerase/deaminase
MEKTQQELIDLINQVINQVVDEVSKNEDPSARMTVTLRTIRRTKKLLTKESIKLIIDHQLKIIDKKE